MTRALPLAMLLLVVAWPAQASPEPAARGRTKIAVLEIRPISVSKQTAELLSEVVLTQASKHEALEVVGPSDVVALLGHEKQKKLLGCNDDAGCMAEIAGALGADHVLVGTVGKIGKLLRVDLKLVDAKRAKVVQRSGESVDGGEERLVEVVQRSVDELVAPLAGKGAGKPPSAAVAGATAPAPDPAPGAKRRISFNGKPLSAAGLRTIEQLEARGGGHLAEGAYFYDPMTGAAGLWGGPAMAILPPGLDLNGRVPANASGGGAGTLTNVFMNGRELHPIDVRGLQELVGVVYPGRWWVDAQGNYGLEGGPVMGNLLVLAQARRSAGGGGGAWSRRYESAGGGSSMNLASDGQTTCVSTGSYTRCTGE